MVSERDLDEAKKGLARLYMKGHKGESESEALHQVEKFLGLQKEPQNVIRENWERKARYSEDTPDLTPEKRKISHVVKYPIPKKEPVPPRAETKDELIARLLEEIRILKEENEELRALIKR